MIKTAAIVVLSILLAQHIYAQKPAGKNRPRTPIINGMASFLPHPEYPQHAREKCAGGEIVIEVLLNEKGEVISTKALSGEESLREAAVDAVRKAKFRMFGYARLKGFVVYNFDSLRTCIP